MTAAASTIPPDPARGGPARLRFACEDAAAELHGRDRTRALRTERWHRS